MTSGGDSHRGAHRHGPDVDGSGKPVAGASNPTFPSITLTLPVLTQQRLNVSSGGFARLRTLRRAKCLLAITLSNLSPSLAAESFTGTQSGVAIRSRSKMRAHLVRRWSCSFRWFSSCVRLRRTPPNPPSLFLRVYDFSAVVYHSACVLDVYDRDGRA